MAQTRAKIWKKYLLGTGDIVFKKRKIYHNIISNYPYSIDSKTYNIICKDIERTIIKNNKPLDDEIRKVLETILTQYAQIMPCDGYLQGFNYIPLMLYKIYSKEDKEHALADTWWSTVSVVSIIRPMIPDHDPKDFFRYTKKWSKYYINHLKYKNNRIHTLLEPYYETILHVITVKWLMIWFAQLFDIEEIIHIWDAIITCDSNKRTKLLAIIAANITLQFAPHIEKWSKSNEPTAIHGEIWNLKAKNAQQLITDSRIAMVELKLPGL
tara:strand:+ start:2139 stop:2942 length:804 start_codon:yes stop_codon:yes gene_type:complete